MLSALETIQTRGPQFAADPRLSTLIVHAARGVDATVFGDDYGVAVGLKVLHWLTHEQMSGASPAGTGANAGTQTGGGVSSKSEGELSISYRDPASSASSLILRNPHLSSTQFGLEYLALLREVVGFAALNRGM
jgi:hypothetical protein